MVGRVLVLLASLVVAAIGAGLVLLYASQARDAAARDLELVGVYVAQRDIAAGTNIAAVLADGSVTVTELPRDTLIPGVVRPDETPLTPDQLAQFLTGPLGSSQQLTADDIGPTVTASEDELGLVASQRNAISITLDDEQRVGPFLDPGDNVALFLTYTPEGETAPCTRVLVPSITVLGVGAAVRADPTLPAATAAPQAAGPATGALLTLQVSRETPLAARIRHATSLGGLSAVLLDEGRSYRDLDECVDVKDLFLQDETTPPVDSAG